MPLEVDLNMHAVLTKYGIRPDADDVNSLRAYFVIAHLEKRVRDKSNWVLGFAFCASIWAVHANVGPFGLMSELFNYLGLSRDVAGIINLVIFSLLWFAIYLFSEHLEDRAERLWRATDNELADLGRRIKKINSSQKS